MLLANDQVKNAAPFVEANVKDISHLLRKWSHIFSKHEFDNGYSNILQHQINTANLTPIKSRPYKIPKVQQCIMESLIQDLLTNNIIRKSKNPWCTHALLVKKKDGSNGLCIDYRRLNSITKRDQYSLPLIDELVDRLAGSKVFSIIDLKSGFWQCFMNESDKQNTAFCPGPDLGLYEFNVMPFGLTNVPATFQRLMDNILGQTITILLTSTTF
ncbi:Retrovirus-related Pol polyprotein [Thelohanellus kitauei]|uniref:Retrovirus-related Pol polyprotein n=1 Tax=Thelohanellus kitauei TaxID=669202 RepID=A0A0C2N3G9_THEKT|nr:Retrovirus-related Pol polyprotein [Thelohanellus kitauei]